MPTRGVEWKLFLAGFLATVASTSGGARAGIDPTGIMSCPSCEAALAQAMAAQNSPLNSPGSNNVANVNQMKQGISYTFAIGGPNGTGAPAGTLEFNPNLPTVTPTPVPSLNNYVPPQAGFTTNCSLTTGYPQYVICPDAQGNVDAILPQGLDTSSLISVQSLLPASGPLAAALPTAAGPVLPIMVAPLALASAALPVSTGGGESF